MGADPVLYLTSDDYGDETDIFEEIRFLPPLSMVYFHGEEARNTLMPPVLKFTTETTA